MRTVYHRVGIWGVLLGCIPTLCWSQVALDHDGLHSAAMRYMDAFYSVESSIGQVFYQQWSGTDAIITEGFQQPINVSPLMVDVKVMINDCDQTYEVEITQISGCNDQASYTIQWNGVAAGMKTYALPEFSTLRIISSDGCVFEQAYFLSAMHPQLVICDLMPFNYLTPNGDGQNDYFHIENIDRPIYKNAKVVVFNRWGNLVWQGENYDNESVKWIGLDAQGKQLPSGTYFFTIDVLGTSKNGFVELKQ